MSLYQFSTTPSFGIGEEAFVTWNNGFSNEEINQIISIGESLNPVHATVGSGEIPPETLRKSKTSWISLNNNTGWLYDRLAYIANQLNGQFYRYDIYGFKEDFQYTVYEGEGGHYTWHLDSGFNNETTRKLTLVLQLSDPSEYEGGDIEILTSDTPLQVAKQKGLLCAFPGFRLHRVTPVTSGIRRTLVIWTTGPAFK